MNTLGFVQISDMLPALIGAMMFALIFALWWKRRNQRHARLSELDRDTKIEGNAQDLAAAEANLNVSKNELRSRILSTHGLYDRYSTLQGFSESYMSEMTTELSRSGISYEILFQETVPVGVADVMLQQGMFELYIQRDQMEEADRLIKGRLRRQ